MTSDSAIRRSGTATAVAFLVLGVLMLAAGLALSAAAPRAEAAASADPVIAIGGDIACEPGKTVTSTKCQQAKTGNLVTGINPVAVLPLGDSQYDAGTPSEYAGSYNTTGWGTLKGISRPAAGNHEYHSVGASGYYGYFGANAGDPAKGYYSYNITGPNGAFRWHLIALNSECSDVGGCGVGSPQEVWLKNDLAANGNTCTIAYWHRPRFSSSSTTPSSTTYRAFWNALYAAGADVVLAGHAHDYERFAPQTAEGAADPTRGITEFVVGTGGDGFHSMGTRIANSVVSQNTSFGILKMTLHASGYDWQFLPAAGYSFTDSGTASCHAAPAKDTTPPSQPTGLTATAPSANQVNLSWTASSDNVGVKNYNIYRGANGGTRTLLTTTTTNATTFTDTSVVEQTPYTYQVQAIDAAGNVSPMSAVASVTTPPAPDSTPPTTPTNVVAEVISGNEVDLAWTPSTDGGTGVSGYQVFRGPTGAATLTLLGTTTGSAPNYQDSTASPNTRYDYQVSAFDGAGNISARSARVTAATPPGPPTQSFTFPIAADATIDQANAAMNLGAGTRLVTDNSPVNDFLLKFDVSAPSCQSILGATLRLTNADSSDKGGDFYTTGAGWSEFTVTWDSAPGRGVLLNSLGAVTSGTTYTVNVTEGVTTFNGEVDFRVASTSTNGARYYSKEGGTAAQRPQLTLTCDADTTDTLEPTAPTGLTATAPNSSEVNLSWTASTDNLAVTGYRIYRGSSVIATVAGDALSFQDITVQPSTTYSYRVTAVDAAGNESPTSNSASVTTPADTSPPTVPMSLSATASGTTQIDLTWVAASDNVGVTAYDISRDGSPLTSVEGSTTSYSDTTVVPGVTYEYRVRSRDSADNASAFSDPASARTTVSDTLPPTPPDNLTATAGGPTRIQLAWGESTDDVGVVGYDVYRDGSLAGSVDGATTTYADTSLTPSTTYEYVVKARDAADNVSLASNTASATTDADTTDTTDPTAPTNLTATAAGPNRIDLAWGAASDNVAVTGYDIYRGAVLLETVGESSTTYADTSVEPSTRYEYFVTAHDAAGNVSPSSNTADATTPEAPDTQRPTPPSDLTAVAASTTEIDLAWTASSDNVGVVGYEVYRDGSLAATVDGATTTYADASLTPSTTYAYVVKARDAADNVSLASNTASASTADPPDTEAPTPPSNLSATAASSTRVDLSWSASTDNVGVAAYDIYRNGSFLKSVTGTAGSDTTVVASTSYSYIVRARDATGNVSGDSNTASVTTPAGSPTTQTLTFSPAADATVDQTSASTNFGTNTRLITDNSPVNDFLVKFAVSAPTCQSITSATLRLSNTDSSSKGGDFYATGSSWTESAVNWTTAPARGALLASLGSVSSGNTYTVNVTGGVTTLNGNVSFRIGSTSGDGARYYSKEGGTASQDPLLTVTCT